MEHLIELFFMTMIFYGFYIQSENRKQQRFTEKIADRNRGYDGYDQDEDDGYDPYDDEYGGYDPYDDEYDGDYRYDDEYGRYDSQEDGYDGSDWDEEAYWDEREEDD
jgi:hypothetical protein